VTTGRACVVGWPVKHSRSPLIHGYWLRELGIDGAYGIEEVPPDRLADFLMALGPNGYAGCNVTIPHKEAALRLADRTSTTARAVGSANTLWFEDGALCADNTDVAGFLASLDETCPGWSDSLSEAVVLGAGGAARGIVWGLCERDIGRIHVVNRNLERARMLTELDDRVNACSWDQAVHLLPRAGLLVNATSLGMAGQPPLSIDLTPLPGDAVVNDLVYVPLETGLLAAARARGNRTVDGLGMLLHQAVPGFERWFGIRPKVTQELRDLIAADITGV
jgi:shikimate dehydrogenase